MNVLFVCSRNRLRSPTAEWVFSGWAEVETAPASTSADAEAVVSAEVVEWADLIFAMEAVHKRRLRERFGPLLRTRRIVVLHIADRYGFVKEGLVKELEAKVPRYRRRSGECL